MVYIKTIGTVAAFIFEAILKQVLGSQASRDTHGDETGRVTAYWTFAHL